MTAAIGYSLLYVRRNVKGVIRTYNTECIHVIIVEADGVKGEVVRQ